MHIVITGSSGLIGSALIPYLRARGHNVSPVVRSIEATHHDHIRWDPERNFIDYRDLDEVDVIINLSGENIAEGRWTDAKKDKILKSRVNSTNFLAQVIASLKHKPKCFINASAIGFYGSQGDSILTEKSPKGTGFLSDVCSAWENATDYARREGVRTCLLRFGIVLDEKGGALANMLPPFKAGLGGKIGSGDQWWSWIALEDLCAIISHVIEQPDIEGPVNVVSPFPVTNKEFTKTLGAVLGRPTFLSIPKFAARFVFGEMADEMMLSSQRVEPDKLVATNFSYKYPKLDQALKSMIRS